MIFIEILFSKVLLIGLLIVSYVPSFSQIQETDKLINLLSKTNIDSERVYLMNELSFKLKDIDSQEALVYAQKALALSQQSNDKENEIKALHNIGILVYDSPKIDSALAYFVKGERMAEEFNFKKLQADHLMSLANWSRYYEKDSTKTVDYFLKSIKVSQEANYNFGIARSYAKLASFYTRYKRILLIEEYLELAAEYYLKDKNRSLTIAHYYNEVANKIWDYNPKKSMDLYYKGLKYSDSHPNIKISLAKAHMTIGKPKIALNYLDDALTHLDPKQDASMTSIAQALLAEVYLELGDHDAALMACNTGIALLDSVSRSNRRGLPALYRTKGLLMELKGEDRMALDFYTKSFEVAITNNETYEIAKANVVLGHFLTRSDPEKAEQYCNIALDKANKNNINSLEISACDCL